MRKANAILEYGIVIIIGLLFLTGIQLFLRRHIEGRVKDESDRTIGHAIGLEWPEQTYTVGGSSGSADRFDAVGGTVQRSSSQSDWSLTYSQPVPKQIMKHKEAAMHVQDSAKSPPTPSYPELQREEWSDPNQPKPD